LYFEVIVSVKGFFELLNPTAADDFIGIVQHDHGRRVALGAFIGEETKGHDGDSVPFFAEVGDGAIKDDCATTVRSGNGVGLEAVAVRLVADQNFFEWRDARGFEEFLVNRHTALVVHIRVGNDRAVDFGAEKMFEHWRNLAA
jgi:hypothetical protein